jgi:hypothetical protein
VNANDAQLIEVLTCQHGSTVQDNAPNAPYPGAAQGAPSYDVVIEGNAGNVIGNSTGQYTLSVTTMDLTAMTHAAALDPVIPAQAFKAPLWNQNGALPTNDFDTEQVFTITLPNPNTYAGHILQYVASLVSVNDQVVSILESEPFTLV